MTERSDADGGCLGALVLGLLGPLVILAMPSRQREKGGRLRLL